MKSTTVRILRSQRGAAITEFAVCLVFLLPMLYYTIFMGDVLYVGLKTADAAGAAAWWASGQVLHDYQARSQGAHDAKVAAAASGGAGWVQSKWDSWDTFYDKASGPRWTKGYALAAPTNGAFETGKFTLIQCEHDTQSPVPQLNPTYGDQLNNHGVIWCNAQVELRNEWFPKKSGVNFDKSDVFRSSFDPIPLCAVGWATNKFCDFNRSALTLLTDDWAVNDNAEMPRDTPTNNQELEPLAHHMYDSTGQGYGAAAKAAAMAVVMQQLDDPDLFRNAYYKYGGETYGVSSPAQDTHSGSHHWNTIHWAWKFDNETGSVKLQNASYLNRNKARGTCYLGADCADVPQN